MCLGPPHVELNVVGDVHRPRKAGVRQRISPSKASEEMAAKKLAPTSRMKESFVFKIANINKKRRVITTKTGRGEIGGRYFREGNATVRKGEGEGGGEDFTRWPKKKNVLRVSQPATEPRMQY